MSQDKESELKNALHSEALSVAILESPIFRIMQLNIIKQTYLGGVVMACLIVGLWNIINALQIDAVTSGVVSLSVGAIMLLFQVRGLFSRAKSPPKKGVFKCVECRSDVPFDASKKGYPDILKCQQCGYEHVKQIEASSNPSAEGS